MITPSFSLTATERVLPRLALDFTTGALDPRVTVTRALNTATRVNSSGYIEGVNADLPRFDYDPVTLAPKGLLIEEQRTNLLTYSQDMSNVAWSDINGTKATSSVVGPDGVTNLTQFTATGAGGNRLQFSGISVTSGTAYTLSAVMAAGNMAFGGLVAAVSANAGAIFDLSGNGAVVSTAGLGVTATIQKLSATLFRCTMTFAATATGTINIGWGVSDGSTYASGIYPSAPSGFIYGSFAQLETGAFATSYIPTTTTSLTRNADVVSMTGTNFSSWWNDTAGTFVVYADMTTLAGNLRTLGLNNSPCAISYISNSSKLSVFDGTVVETTNEPLAGVMYKAATGYNASNKYAVLNAGAQVSAARDAGFPITPGSSLQIGSDRGIGSFLCGHVYKLMYYPQLLTAAEMQALTK